MTVKWSRVGKEGVKVYKCDSEMVKSGKGGSKRAATSLLQGGIFSVKPGTYLCGQSLVVRHVISLDWYYVACAGMQRYGKLISPLCELLRNLIRK